MSYEPVHREGKPPAQSPKPNAPLAKVSGYPAQSKLHAANNMTTIPIPQHRLDPKRFPELTWPWRWAYVPSTTTTTTTNPAARVIVPINHETQAIHPSYYDKFPSAVTGTPVAMNSNTASMSLPIRGSVGRLQPISVGGSAASAHKSHLTRVANLAATDKIHPPGREAHLLFDDEYPLPYPSIESFEERFNYSFGPSSTSKPPSPAGSPIRLPNEGVHIGIPSPDYGTNASARHSARMESIGRYRRQACSDEKDLDELLANKEQNSQRFPTILKRKILERREMKDAKRCTFEVMTAKGVASTLLNPKVQSVSAQTAGGDADRRLEEDLRRALGSVPMQSTTEENTSTQAAFNVKRERWLAVDKPKITQEEKAQDEFMELALGSDEEDWEKVDGDDEWEVVDDPRGEVERKANEQSKVSSFRNVSKSYPHDKGCGAYEDMAL